MRSILMRNEGRRNVEMCGKEEDRTHRPNIFVIHLRICNFQKNDYISSWFWSEIFHSLYALAANNVYKSETNYL
jgi:hypothetical protein